jgi:hypothetical protein
MAFTRAQIDALKTSIAQGALTVQFADRTTTYRSLREMRDTLVMMEADVSTSSRPRAYTAWSDKGL